MLAHVIDLAAFVAVCAACALIMRVYGWVIGD